MKLVKLDLHGLKHEHVRNEVIRFIEDAWGKDLELEIITGNSIKMKDIVLQVLEEYKLPFSIGRMCDLNDACIITWT